MRLELTAAGRNPGRNTHRPIAIVTMAILLGTGILMSGCATAAPPAYTSGYPAYGYLDFDYWDGPIGFRHADHDRFDHHHFDHRPFDHDHGEYRHWDHARSYHGVLDRGSGGHMR